MKNGNYKSESTFMTSFEAFSFILNIMLSAISTYKFEQENI